MYLKLISAVGDFDFDSISLYARFDKLQSGWPPNGKTVKTARGRTNPHEVAELFFNSRFNYRWIDFTKCFFGQRRRVFNGYVV